MKSIKVFVFIVGLCMGMWASQSVAADGTQLPDLGSSQSAQSASSEVAKKALAEDAKCTQCHDENWPKPVLSIYQTKMGVKADPRAPVCQSCHGASNAHLETPENSPDVIFKKGPYAVSDSKVRSGQCLDCHQGDKRTHWTGSQHQTRDLACNSCHQVHTPNDKVLSKATQKDVCYQCHQTIRAQTLRISTHPIDAGKVACSDCHNPHGSAGPKQMTMNTINDTCYTCHAEKRGPFLWEHPPATDDCMNCHTPHGSTNAGLLKMRSPWLCQQCHGDAAPHPGAIYSAANLPGGTVNIINQPTTGATSYTNPLTGQKIAQTNPASQLAYRGCANCHSQIHGSNHPAGFWYAR